MRRFGPIAHSERSEALQRTLEIVSAVQERSEAHEHNVVLQIVGPRKSGKTTLLEHLIRELRRLGVEPKVVKQTKHSLSEVDAGDTKRAMLAGSNTVYLLCKDGIRVQLKKKVAIKLSIE